MPSSRGYFPHSGSLIVCLFLALAACNGAAGCGREPASEQLPQTTTEAPVARTDDERPKLVVLGDSLTAGLGLLDTQSFPSLLQQRIDTDGFEFEVVNGGVSGDTSAGGLRRLDWVLQEDVRVLIVALGANDGLRGLSVAEMKRNLEQIIETARARQVLVILAGMEAPPNYGAQYATSFRQVYRDLALQYRVPFIPFLLDKVAGQPALNQTDGIHPNAAGAAVVADTVWSVLKPMLDQLSAS
jgi:acyl-CoA thioesterase I